MGGCQAQVQSERPVCEYVPWSGIAGMSNGNCLLAVCCGIHSLRILHNQKAVMCAGKQMMFFVITAPNRDLPREFILWGEKPYLSLPRATFFVVDRGRRSTSPTIERCKPPRKPRAPRACLRVDGSLVLVVVVDGSQGRACMQVRA